VSKAAKSAPTTKSAAPSNPAATPAVSRPAPANGSPNPEPDYALPSAAEIAALLPTSRVEPTGKGELDEDDAGDDITPIAETPEADEAEAEDAPEAEAPEVDADDAEPTAEAETEAEPSAEGEAEAEAETEAPEKPEPSRFQKRIDELTERGTKAEQEAATLREQLAAAKQAAPPDPLNPFNLIDTEAELAAAVDREESFMEWIMANEANPDGGDLADGKGGTVHFEPEQIRQMKVSTYRILRTAEKRRAYIQQKVSREAEAVAAYPWLRNAKDGLGAEVQSTIEARPYLRQSPDYRTFAADAVLGAKLRAAGLKLDSQGLASLLKGRALRAPAAPGQPGIAGTAAVAAARAQAPVRRMAPSPARPGSLPPKVTGREAVARQANRALQSGAGSVASVEDSIAAKFRW
jgi:hypothetical protein